ncbi:hypothetical protein J4W00_24345, partial [Escherichia coli]
ERRKRLSVSSEDKEKWRNKKIEWAILVEQDMYCINNALRIVKNNSSRTGLDFIIFFLDVYTRLV